MDFKDLIRRYKEGIATEEEIEFIELEIEKYEAIEEYLVDNMGLDFITLSENKQKKGDSQKLQKSVNRRLRKVVALSVSIVLAILISIFYIISPIIDSIYYNPNKISFRTEVTDLVYDLYTFTELNIPGYGLRFPLIAENSGFGKYNIYFGRSNQLTQVREVINMKIERGKLLSIDKSLYTDSLVYFPTYTDSDAFDEEAIKRNNERVMDHLKQLNPVSYVASFITFDRDLTMEELHKLQWDYSVRFIWAGIRTEPEEETYKTITGFRLDNTSAMQINNNPDTEKYPAFDYHDWLRENGGRADISNWPKAYVLHYKTLLKYMIDRKDVVLTLEKSPSKYEYYKSALEYVEENGVNTFGVLVYANPEDLIELVENGPVKAFGIDEVLASKRYIY